MLGEPGHGKSSLCIKMVSNFFKKQFCPNKVRKVFSFSLNPTTWIKEPENPLDVKNIFILPNKQIMLNGKHQNIILGMEYLKESLIFLDGYDELYLRLQENSKNTISFLKELKELAKDWNLKIIVTSRKTCINPSDLYKYGYRVCQLAKLTKEKQKKWINDVYNTKLFPKKPYDIKKLYSHQYGNVQSKILELLEIPILLQLIVSNYFYGDAQNIVELYDKLFKEILNTREELIIDNYDENRSEEFKQIFELFAYDIYKNNDKYAIVGSKELRENKNMKWKSLLLFYITSEKKQNEYYIEFVHRSFYQYFQAWYFYNLVLKIVKEKTEEKVANLFEAICWRKLEIDIINMIKQINQNQKRIQEQEQIQYILDIFEETDGFVKNTRNNKCCVPIGQPNVLDRVKNILYNLIMLLNTILPNSLTLLEGSRIAQLMKNFDMSDIYLPGINMSGMSLEGANLKRANLIFAHLEDAHLEGAYLTEAYLANTDLEGTYLTGAYLEGAILEGANLKGANLKRANLTGAYLRRARLTNAHLEGAYLTNAHLEMATLEETYF